MDGIGVEGFNVRDDDICFLCWYCYYYMLSEILLGINWNFNIKIFYIML